MIGILLGSTNWSRPTSLYSGRKTPQVLIQCALSKTKLMIQSIKPGFLASRSNPLSDFISCSGLMMTAWYLRFSIALGHTQTKSPFYASEQQDLHKNSPQWLYQH